MLFATYDTTVLKVPNHGLDPLVLKAVNKHDTQSLKPSILNQEVPMCFIKEVDTIIPILQIYQYFLAF